MESILLQLGLVKGQEETLTTKKIAGAGNPVWYWGKSEEGGIGNPSSDTNSQLRILAKGFSLKDSYETAHNHTSPEVTEAFQAQPGLAHQMFV